MGSCLSSSSKPLSPSKKVRIVHLNGMVEDFNPPISVNQLINSSHPKHFICTPSQLLSPYSKPLNSNTKLEPGSHYFLLPYSTLDPDVSPINLATLAKQLSKKARTENPQHTRCISSRRCSSSPSLRVQTRTQARGPEHRTVEDYKVQQLVRAWKPILETIIERSFRNLSDLHERYVRDPMNTA